MKKAFINGKRAMLHSEEGKYFLLHSVQTLPNNAAPKSKKGFYFAVALPEAESIDDAEILASEYGEIIVEGTPEFEAMMKEKETRKSKAEQTEAPEAPKAEPVESIDAAEVLNNALSAVIGGLAPTVAAAIVPTVNAWAESIADKVRAEATPAQDNAPIVDTIRVIDGPRIVEMPGRAHAKLEELLQVAKAGVFAYLYGPAGTGKSTLAKQLAKALGIEFYFDNKIMNEFAVTGFVDAAGNYQETEFYRAYTRGGVYMLDELDASDENALTVLNNALAGDSAVFPGVGRVQRHADFYAVATGNTIGRGADAAYTARNCQDAALLDRFPAKIFVGYDLAVELANAGGDQNLVELFHELRKAANDTGVMLTVTPRALNAINRLKHYYKPARALEVLVFGGLEKDQVKILSDAVQGTGEWFDALKELAA